MEKQVKKLLFAFVLFTTPAMADINIVVSKKHQSMEIYQDGELLDVWPVSTARKGFITPTGTFNVQSMESMHYSRLYDMSPMPWSIFFNGNIAIHGTPHVGNLGRPASHGCVRLSPTNAAILYDIVRGNRNETTITIK